MRAGLSTIQQTLTPEAAAVLTQSIEEARRRSHGQTTPLHAAATLLSSPSGHLRHACIRSHPNSAHPLHCRALDLCFCVALDRLPSSAASTAADPPLSNALMAALKRAQAQQRRHCPEQQQQPLLAVKVELDHLIISILDDPTVSRVMREASFSSPAVKSAIATRPLHPPPPPHRLLNFSPRLFANPTTPCPPPPNRPSFNPRLHPPTTAAVADVMSRTKRRNPVFVGDAEAEAAVSELLKKVKSEEFESDDAIILKNIKVISMENEVKMEELGGLVESKIGEGGGVIVDLGDLKWVVAAPEVVEGVAKVVARFRGEKLWLIGSASCETYLRCQVYHSTMENDWDLQPLPMPSRFPRLETERLLSTPIEPSPISRHAPENTDPLEPGGGGCCAQCSENYEKEAAKLTSIHKSFSEAAASQPSLPQWLQNAKLDTNAVSPQVITTQELQKKWRDVCLHLHPNFHQNKSTFSPTRLYNLSLPPHPTFQLSLQAARPSRGSMQLGMERANSPPCSPVRTDLVLGRKGTKNNGEEARDLLGCASSQPQNNDAETFKKLLKGLMEKAWWQAEAASTVASAITSCRSGNGKRRGSASRGDMWLLFTGPDRVGKQKMAIVIAEQICGTSPIMIYLGAKRGVEESDTHIRGRTVIDRIADVVRRNPSSVIVLQDIDEVDMLVQGSIKQAIESGRIVDSHGRDFNLGNCIFILTGDWSRTNLESARGGYNRFVDEKKLASIASRNWELGLVVKERSSKRHASWSLDVDGDDEDDNDRLLKPRREAVPSLSLDLNLTVTDSDKERTDGSRSSSDLTNDHEEDLSKSIPQDLLNNMNAVVAFMAVDSGFIRAEIRRNIFLKFLMMVGEENLSLEIEDDVLDRILGGIWHDRTSLKEWIEKVLEPSFDQIKPRLSTHGDRSSAMVVQLEVESGRWRSKNGGDWLPSRISV